MQTCADVHAPWRTVAHFARFAHFLAPAARYKTIPFLKSLESGYIKSGKRKKRVSATLTCGVAFLKKVKNTLFILPAAGGKRKEKKISMGEPHGNILWLVIIRQVLPNNPRRPGTCSFPWDFKGYGPDPLFSHRKTKALGPIFFRGACGAAGSTCTAARALHARARAARARGF